MTPELPAKYEQACKMLADLVKVDEVKAIRDKARAMQVYAAQAKDTALMDHATDIRLRAERRAGELLAEMAERKERAEGGKKNLRPGSHRATPEKAPKLADLNITKSQSSRWQKLADLDEAAFESKVSDAKRIAVASVEGNREMIHAARKAQQDAKRARRAEREAALGAKVFALPDKKYGVIVGDPQWGRTVYSQQTGMDRHAANHYPVAQGDEETQDDEIKALDVASIAADDCVLGLWCTETWRGEAVARAWGFKPAGRFVWCKDIIVCEPADNGMLSKGQLLEVVGAAGMGFWNRDRDEIMLICTRGKPVCPAQGMQGESVWFARRGEHAATRDGVHSDKPECSLEWFERHWPNTPKIELNRRGPARPGWDAWGNEVSSEAAE